MKATYSRRALLIASALFSIILVSAVSAVTDKGDQQYEYSGRDEWQKPDEVLKNMHLEPGHVVADIGAGTGYFTRRFAKAVGPGGMALGLEVSSSSVESMKKDAERLGLDNYKAILVKTNDPELDAESVDVVFLCNAYHHLQNRVDYFKTTSRALKKDGRVVIVDFYNKQMAIGPPPSHTLSKDVVLEEMKAAGYKLQKDKDFLSYQYYLEFGLK